MSTAAKRKFVAGRDKGRGKTLSLMIMKNSFIIFSLLLISAYGFCQKPADPFAHTFSIVARDPATGQIAVAVQSHWFSVGTVVAWGEAGVGVVATQSFVNKSFGIRGLALLKQGKTPEEAVKILLQDDAGKDFRQLAILNAAGQVSTHTGAKCVDVAGHYAGDGFSVQANMMLNDKVVPAMTNSWTNNSSLPFAERIVAVLKDAQQAGGDIRGKQSAALLIFSAHTTAEPWNDKLIDLRVDDAENPIDELERLLKVHRAYEHMNQGDLYVERNEMEKAMEEYHAAMKLFPENLEMQYWTAITLANNKQVKEATAMLQKIYKQDANWRELTKRLPKVGLLTVSSSELGVLTK